MATGAGLLRRAREHIHEQYVNTQVPKDDPNWKGPWDCAEFISWLVFQEAGILYGCVDDNAKPSQADAYTGAWQTDLMKRGTRVSVDEAAATIGGIVLRYPPGPGKMGHIALCDGKGGTVEAKGRLYGVVADTVHGRGWHTGILIPGISYDAATETIAVKAPATLYALGAPNMDKAIIVKIQQALSSKGFNPGDINGEYERPTALAIAAFQDAQGLVVDGEVGPDTAGALGISLTAVTPIDSADTAAQGGAKPVATTPGTGDGTMNPLIAIAASVLPEIIKFIVGDGADAVTGQITKAVTDVTRTTNPEQARDKLKSDPTAVTALQVKLAEIAAAQEEKRQQAQLAALQAQNEAEAQKREAMLEELRASIEDTKSARSTFSALALANNPMAWGAPIVSAIVTLGFFGILVILLVWPHISGDEQVKQIINISVGALAAGFATVISFWLGSSQGSRQKDVAIAEQAKQTTEAIDASAKRTQIALEATRKSDVERKPAVEAAKTSNFARCLDVVFAQEGGFSNDRDDPGGPTQFGITIHDLKQFRHDESLTADDVKKLTRDEAREIYRTKYWNVLRCDDLPVGVDLVVFDMGVNAGPSRSAKIVQAVVGAEADGSMGPATIAAIKAMSPRDIIVDMSDRRLEFYRGLANAPTFIRGWTNRTNAVEKAALQMIGNVTAIAA
jgi:lysozyme family protein/peptidoglycan hydrolase-like protein with peptidoglycan-binding domain